MRRAGRVEVNLQNVPELQKFVLSNVRPTGRDLGSGAYGSVEEVEIPGATCAAKRIHESLLRMGNADEIKNITDAFVRECQLMSTLHHPHIVQFLGVCFLSGSRLPVLVMEQLMTSLNDLLETNPNVPLAIKSSILHDVACGLAYLHSHLPPIIHRDLTAKNVLLNSAMVAKLADLGMARIVDIQPGQLVATMTQAPGTVVYMPPEALEPKAKYNATLDIFSIGVLALYTLTQIFPVPKAPTYLNSDGRIVGRSEIDRRVEYIQEIHQKLGRQHPLVLMIEQCLHNDPRNRPTIDQVLQRLEEAKVQIQDRYGNMSKLEVIQALGEKEEEVAQLHQKVTSKAFTTPEKRSYKTRDDFPSDENYGQYVRANLQVGMYVRATESYEDVSEGDLGIYKQTNEFNPPAQFAWDGLGGDTYWVYWHQVVILPNPYKTRHDFSSDGEYGQYVKRNLRVGMQVRARVDYERVVMGYHGIYKQTNDGFPPAQFAWDGLDGDTYWVYWHQVEILPKPYKTRADFSSDHKYGQYIKDVLEVGMHVRAVVDYESVSKGDHGIYKQTNDGTPPAQFAWDGLDGNTYWVYWHQVEIVSPAL